MKPIFIAKLRHFITTVGVDFFKTVKWAQIQKESSKIIFGMAAISIKANMDNRNLSSKSGNPNSCNNLALDINLFHKIQLSWTLYFLARVEQIQNSFLTTFSVVAKYSHIHKWLKLKHSFNCKCLVYYLVLYLCSFFSVQKKFPK